MRTAPRADPDERLEKHPAPRSGHRGMWCRLPFCLRHTVFRPCVRRMEALEWHCPRAAAFPPLPPSQRLPVVRKLRRYYAAVRLPGCVHRRRMVTPFPTRSTLDCSTEWIAPWPMHLGSPDSRPRCIHTCSGLRPRRVYSALALTSGVVWPSVRWDHVGTRKSLYFGAQYWACTLPCQRFTGVITGAGA